MHFAHRSAATATVGVLLIAACSAGGDEVFVTEPGQTAPASPGATAAPTTIDTASTSAPATSIPAEPTQTAAPASTTAPRWEDLIGVTCDSLAADGYETRKATLARFREAAERAEAVDRADGVVSAACEPAFRATVEAIALEQRRNELDLLDTPVEFSQIECAEGAYQFVVTNLTEHTIGVHVAFRIFVGDDEQPTSSADYPIVIWQLEPGAAQGITGEFAEPTSLDGYRCSLIARIFDGSTAAVGAGLLAVSDAALTGDDPADWFGELLGREVDAVGSGDADSASLTEDLRSMFYDNVLAFALGDEESDRVPSSVTICRAAVDQPDDDRLSMVYFVSYPTDDGGNEGFLRHGLFRRGTDGQWRWLSAAHYFDSPDFHDCGRPGLQSP